jgi:sialate O-acetylesterase
MMRNAINFFLGLILMSGCNGPKIELKIAQVFSNHMVLQQDQPNAVWGNAAPNTEITLTSSWGEEIIVKSDSFGHWTLLLPTPRFNKDEPSKNYSIHVTDGDSKIDISDVLIGEVWLASGQSNMEWRMNECEGCVINQTEEIKNSNNPSIRMFSVPKDLTNQSLKHTKWLSANQKNTGNFSATAYYFAKKLHDELKVPIGIINSSWGGTRIESWISSKKLNRLDETKSFIPEDYTFLGYQDYIRKRNDSLIGELNTKYGFSNFNVPQPKILMETGLPVKEELFNQFLKKWEDLNLGDDAFKDPEFDDDSWEKWTPGLHTYGGLKSMGRFESVFDESDPLLSDGVIWFRTTIEINDISKDYILQVEKGIDDIDQTYFNGKLIGNTLGWNLERKYIIPKRLLRKGKNLIAFRISDTGGGGGFNSQVRIFNEQDSIVLPFEKFKFKHHGFILNGMSLIVHNYSNDQLVELPEEVRKDIFPKPFSNMQNQFSALYECMLLPIIPYGIKGFIWYQGESNVQNHSDYTNLLSAMIDDWRSSWGSNLPFYFAQIAPFIYNESLNSQALRESQRKVLEKVEKTGMAVLLDIGEELDIHPENKKDVGERLSFHALKNEYGMDIITSGPLYREHLSRENYIEVSFDHSNKGLISKGDLIGFEVAGSDGIFYPAIASIFNNKVRAFSNEVSKPIHIRYGWKNWFVGTLYNTEGLPASSFSSQ